MYSLTIQGIHAPGFRFKSNSGQEFRSFVESVTLNYTTLICSKYRTDLIYFSDQDRQEEILKMWSKVVGKKYSAIVKRRFMRSKGKQITLENYFTSLIFLKRIPDWFNQYRKQVNITIDQEPNHPIHKVILGCARHLASNQTAVNLPLIQANKFSIASFLLKNNKTFATGAIKNYLYN